jgi:hypothetical protein
VPLGSTADTRGDNFEPLATLDWQVHVYGTPAGEIAEVCAARGLGLHAFPWGPAASRAGLERDVFYLVRPDGYVALTDSADSPTALEAYLEARRIRPR